MKPTGALWLAALALVGVGLGWLLVSLVDAATGRILNVPMIASIALWVLSIGLLVWALVTRSRLRAEGQDPFTGIIAARTAALALAASRTGAITGGFYLGIMLALLGTVATPTGSASVTAALVAVGAAIALTVTAVWLESLCRIKPDA